MSTRPTLPRRSMLAVAALAAGVVGAPALLGRGAATAAELSGRAARLPSGLFTLGVASGDPLPDGVVLWTRLAPDPLNGGGMPQQNMPTDPDLQAAHAHVPWIVTFDDHEIDNNWADDVPQDPAQQSFEQFRARRIAAFKAYYEHMPLRRSAIPAGPDVQVFRRLNYGRLATVHVLDTRQFRSDQITTLEGANAPSRTITGPEQEAWLVDGMTNSGRRWNLLANQVMWAQNDRTAGPTQSFDFDNWDGYRAERRRLLEFFGSGRTSNPVVLTGDRHATWASDLKPDFDDPASPVVGAEITGTSISTGGDSDPVSFHRTFDPIMAESPHWKYIDNQRGYVRCDVTRERMLASLRTVDTVLQADGTTVSTAAQFVVENGRPGIELAGTPQEARAMRLSTSRYTAVDDDQF